VLVEDTVEEAPWWCKVYGAAWSSPVGPSSSVETRQDHPVVRVSHNDAMAFALWAGKQLPTEAEWEYVARGGLSQKLYPWGNDLVEYGKHLCNIWQGAFPLIDSAGDGDAGTCPATHSGCRRLAYRCRDGRLLHVDPSIPIIRRRSIPFSGLVRRSTSCLGDF
jgi:formylglycine-generating enzyme required for sulfatase activity